MGMDQFIIRSAQSAFNRAGYRWDEAYRQAQMIADYMLSHLDQCRAAYGVDDEFELAYRMACDTVEREREGWFISPLNSLVL
jgi:hypothetical protein